MKKLVVLAMAVVLVCSFSFLAQAEDAVTSASKPSTAAVTSDTKPSISLSESATVTAVVNDIDYVNRIITVTGPRGNTVAVKVGPEAKNFDQIIKGDKIVINYYESVALYLRKSSEVPEVEEMDVVTLAKPGEVMAIDYAARTVTLKGSEGNEVTYKVSDQVKKFDQIKVGDEAVAHVTESVAISVEKP
ncbi:MAG: hypothetical protein NTW13_03160 [Candidatus Omnitrophica bacterium]|nr:hypothetical protein [Candidatus Omnitrophota bacterium]